MTKSLASLWRWITENPVTSALDEAPELAVAFLDARLNPVPPEHAVYELHFVRSGYARWVKCGGKPDDQAGFWLDLSYLWSAQEWEGYTSPQVLNHIRQLLGEHNGRCRFAFD